MYIYIYISSPSLQGRRQGASSLKMDRCERLEEKRSFIIQWQSQNIKL